MNLAHVEELFQATPDQKCAIARAGMVAAAFPEAVQAGVEMLNLGGNAVDAACATTLALAACEPAACGLGGQSIALVHVDGRTVVVDGSSHAPSLAHRRAIADPQELSLGYRASTVPSTVALLGYLSRRYGHLPWAALVAPAIAIAENGYRITPFQHRLQLGQLDRFLAVPGRSGAGYFLRNGDTPYQPGDRFIQPDLAATLVTLAEQGPQAFYQGLIAQRIDEDMRTHGSFLRAEDLALIPWPVEREPLQGHYRDFQVLTTPAPTAGRTLLLILAMLDQVPVQALQSESPDAYRVLLEIIRGAMLHRERYPYHPRHFPAPNPWVDAGLAQELLAVAYQETDAWPSSLSTGPEGGETTHLSVIDAQGNAVGISQSVYEVYGSKAAAAGLGFLYNNYMSCFELDDPGHPYYLRPNATPRTAVAPSMLFRDRRLWLVIGTPGSKRIPAALALFLVNVLDRGLSMGDAMQRPRLHCDPDGLVHLEGHWDRPELPEALALRGYRLHPHEPYEYFFGGIQAVRRCHTRDELHGVADVRRDGIARGT